GEGAAGGRGVRPWGDAGGGVRRPGAVDPAAPAPGLRLAHAAVRRRKPVIVVDLAGAAELPGALAGICASVGAPLYVFGAAGGPRYEPRVRPSAEQHAALLAVSWGPRAGVGAGGRGGPGEGGGQRSAGPVAPGAGGAGGG